MLEGISTAVNMPFSVYGSYENTHAVSGELAEGLWH